MLNKRKIHFLDSTNIILSVENAFTKTAYKYCKESVEKRESLTYVLATIQLKLFLWGRGADTLSTPSPYEQFFLYPPLFQDVFREIP